MRRRAACACLLVVALIAATVGIDRCFPRALQYFGQQAHTSDESIMTSDDDADRDDKEATVTPAIELLDTKQQFGAVVPDAFEREVISVGAFEEVLVAKDASTVGLLSRGSASQVYRRLSEELTDNGWIGIKSGQERVASFVKEGGTYTWLLVSCSEADGWVSAVVQAR